MGINILGEKDSEVAGWLKQKGWSIPGLVGTNLADLQRSYPITGAPETFLLDSNGRIYSHHVGFQSGQDKVIEAEIRLLLGLEPFATD